ncbi:hypothetical protein [Paenibacillus caui]|uniref:hypothetical protein n=1 Tax=Paenibacillus caui TaxID=2873927 RepID=UPI001CA8D3F2|nr:hypothetical protein [Paenibacillus caui]
MKNSSRIGLSIDDYLDLLNLAAQLGDARWQKEIVRKLECIQADLIEKQNV